MNKNIDRIKKIDQNAKHAKLPAKKGRPATGRDTRVERIQFFTTYAFKRQLDELSSALKFGSRAKLCTAVFEHLLSNNFSAESLETLGAYLRRESGNLANHQPELLAPVPILELNKQNKTKVKK